ncbi:hypothetical protein Bca52824_000926 [Brassica carinata]|uniref:Uncharacterized protein n=1 Tax=Brassica carinata TaxID=52824 RepID=A0A8X7WGG3_BRACI|nr:hypothetical protein Bca52824_000926 [Brassica carinata]
MKPELCQTQMGINLDVTATSRRPACLRLAVDPSMVNFHSKSHLQRHHVALEPESTRKPPL